jgi:hypothetical protein
VPQYKLPLTLRRPRFSDGRLKACPPARTIRTMRHIDVLYHDLPPSARVDGLLGLNFLSRFDLRINFKQEFITVR